VNLSADTVELTTCQLRAARTTARILAIRNCHIVEFDALSAERILLIDSYVRLIRTKSPSLAAINSYVGGLTGTPKIMEAVESYIYICNGGDSDDIEYAMLTD
jgi:hypothetical protein